MTEPGGVASSPSAAASRRSPCSGPAVFRVLAGRRGHPCLPSAETTSICVIVTFPCPLLRHRGQNANRREF
jgi:hypothetical protein